jgi:predicted metallo-beta-lactamase superfamily hydrolase
MVLTRDSLDFYYVRHQDRVIAIMRRLVTSLKVIILRYHLVRQFDLCEKCSRVDQIREDLRTCEEFMEEEDARLTAERQQFAHLVPENYFKEEDEIAYKWFHQISQQAVKEYKNDRHD